MDLSQCPRDHERRRKSNQGNQRGGCPHENKSNPNLALALHVLESMDDLSQIFQRLYDFVRDLSACLEHPPVERDRSYDRGLYLECGGLCVEGEQHHPELPAPGIHPRRRIGLHLLYCVSFWVNSTDPGQEE